MKIISTWLTMKQVMNQEELKEKIFMDREATALKIFVLELEIELDSVSETSEKMKELQRLTERLQIANLAYDKIANEKVVVITANHHPI